MPLQGESPKKKMTLQHLVDTAVGPCLRTRDLQGIKLTATAVSAHPGLPSRDSLCANVG